MILDLVVNRVPIPIRESLAGRGGRLIVLHEVDHPDGIVRAWTGAGPLSYDDEIWYGLSDLLSITGLVFSRETKTRNPKLTLSGLTANQLKFATGKVRGRHARISLAVLRPRSRVVNGDIFTLCYATCDFQDHKFSTARSPAIEIGLIQPLFIMDRAPNLKWTPDWLKATYGDDIVGLDDMPGSAARDVSWAPP